MSGNGVFTIDGVDLRVNVINLKRGFSVTDTEHSGRVKSGEMHRDIIGTYYNYTLDVEPNPQFLGDYDTLYEIVSAPTAYHRMRFPYAQATLEFQAYVTNGEDELTIRGISGERIHRWSGMSLQFVAKEPQRRP